jgi:transcriptional regulator with XRE-family HTH domain
MVPPIETNGKLFWNGHGLRNANFSATFRNMKLQEWLTKNAMTHEHFAQIIGVQRSSVTNYVSGAKIPHPRVLQKISVETKNRVTLLDFIDSNDEWKAKYEKHS